MTISDFCELLDLGLKQMKRSYPDRLHPEDIHMLDMIAELVFQQATDLDEEWDEVSQGDGFIGAIGSRLAQTTELEDW